MEDFLSFSFALNMLAFTSLQILLKKFVMGSVLCLLSGKFESVLVSVRACGKGTE